MDNYLYFRNVLLWAGALLLMISAILSAGCATRSLRDTVVMPAVDPASAKEPRRPPSFVAPVVFDSAKAMKHVKALAGTIGVRQAGTRGEKKAAGYLVKTLKESGLKPNVSSFKLPNGRTSQNVSVLIRGETDDSGHNPYGSRYIVLGGHMDSKVPAPGANDNASGMAVLLELARIYKVAPPPISVKIVFFGSEEIIDGNPDHHHYGSRAMVRWLKPGNLIGMISVDDVGVGPRFHVRSMRTGPDALWRQLLRDRRAANVTATFLKDPGWSDHEPFEQAGYPAAWIEWRPDSAGHTVYDKPARIRQDHMEAAARWVKTYLATLTAADVESLTGSAPGR